mmetsp:Transcript_39503/g.87889  ORF Transcript_39503/g.87889 Transcript_39503/m.87889 type:complete len:217 (+) Transcript_39503:1553-2203(+)
MPRQVNQRDHLGRPRNVVTTCLRLEGGVIEDGPGAVQAQRMLADGGGAPGALLVMVLEHLGAGQASAVIQHGASEHPHHGGLATVHITNDCDTHFNSRLHGRHAVAPHQHVSHLGLHCSSCSVQLHCPDRPQQRHVTGVCRCHLLEAGDAHVHLLTAHAHRAPACGGAHLQHHFPDLLNLLDQHSKGMLHTLLKVFAGRHCSQGLATGSSASTRTR